MTPKETLQYHVTGAIKRGEAVAVVERSIISRDIDFYVGEVERYNRELRQCAPADELFYWIRGKQAQDIVDSLRALNSPLGPTP